MSGGPLDHLIDQGNKPADPEVEYIYNLSMMWQEGVFGHLEAPANAVAYNVQRQPNGSYTFMLRGQAGVYQCNYGWAFVLNTPDNVKRLKDLQLLDLSIDHLKTLRKRLFRKISTLDPKSESHASQS